MSKKDLKNVHICTMLFELYPEYHYVSVKKSIIQLRTKPWFHLGKNYTWQLTPDVLCKILPGKIRQYSCENIKDVSQNLLKLLVSINNNALQVDEFINRLWLEFTNVKFSYLCDFHNNYALAEDKITTAKSIIKVYHKPTVSWQTGRIIDYFLKKIKKQSKYLSVECSS
jgi:hypothetical protein